MFLVPNIIAQNQRPIYLAKTFSTFSSSIWPLCECMHVVLDCSCTALKGTRYSKSRQNWWWYAAEETERDSAHSSFTAFMNQRRTELLFAPEPHSHTQSFPAVLQYFPRKVPCLNGSQNWFSGNLAPAISHFENPVTVEGIFWEGLWCEWKHAHYWKAWGAWAARAFFLTHLSPPSLQHPINALPNVSNAVFWCRLIKQKNTTDVSSAYCIHCSLFAQTCICFALLLFGLVHIYLQFIITIMEIITTYKITGVPPPPISFHHIDNQQPTGELDVAVYLLSTRCRLVP